MPTEAKPELDRLLDEADSLVKAHGGLVSPNARLYLTWNEPYGLPRAARAHYPHSRDPRSADTLYLSCLPGRPGKGFVGFMADLEFRAVGGDTLGAWWRMEHGATNNGELTVEFGPGPSFPQRQPWAAPGFGHARITRTPMTSHLEVLFAVPYTAAVPVAADSVYTLCRVILHHRKVLPGCSQPVCVEWSKGELDYWLRDTPTIRSGERFVAYAGEAGICAPFLAPDTLVVPGTPLTPGTARPPGKRSKPRVKRAPAN